jgi:hypothetical protein
VTVLFLAVTAGVFAALLLPYLVIDAIANRVNQRRPSPDEASRRRLEHLLVGRDNADTSRIQIGPVWSGDEKVTARVRIDMKAIEAGRHQ